MTTTDDVTHLRALLAEQTARAEKAEAACAEMRAALVHIRERAASAIGEDESDAIDICDAIERLVGSALGEGDPLTGDLPRSVALLSRTDLGRGVVVVPRERLTAWRDVLIELAPTCRCDEAWTSRGRHEVNALCHMADDAKAAIADLDALLKKGGG